MDFIIALGIVMSFISGVFGFSFLVYWMVLSLHHRYKVRHTIVKPTKKQSKYITDILKSWEDKASISKQKFMGNRWVNRDALHNDDDDKFWVVSKDLKAMAFIPMGHKFIVCVKSNGRQGVSEAIILSSIHSLKVKTIIMKMAWNKNKKVDNQRLSKVDEKLVEMYTEDINC